MTDDPTPDEPLPGDFVERAIELRRRDEERGLTDTERAIAVGDTKQFAEEMSDLVDAMEDTMDEINTALERRFGDLADAMNVTPVQEDTDE
jgi:hypothetical protein